LFEEATDGIFVTDPNGRLVAANLRGSALVGYSREELVGMAAADLIPAAHPAPGPVPTGDSVGEWIATSERHIRHKDGSLIPVEISARTLSDGSVLRLVRDIIAHKRDEEALRQAHAELEQQVAKRASDQAQANRMLTILSECNQTVVRATEEPALLQGVCRIIVELGGYPLVWIGFAEQDAAQTVRPVAQTGFEDGYLESITITWSDTEHGQGPTGRAIRSGQPRIARDIQTDPRFAPWRADAMRRGYASSIALPLWGNDRVFGALNIYAPVADAFPAEEVNLLMELASDLAFGITSLRERDERQRAEQAVRESEARYRAIVEAFDGLIYVCSPDYRVEFMNRQLVERTGYDGTGELCYKVLHELDAICPWCVNEQVFAGETVRWEVQSPRDNRWFYVVNTPIYHADGSMSKQAMILDITERKRMEDELRQNREAALQFSEQLAALQEVTNELSKAGSSDDLCQQAVQLGRSRLGFDRVSIWFIEEHLGIMRGSFGTDEHGELRDERTAQVEFRHEGLAWRLFSDNEPMALVEHCPLCDHLGREVGEGDNALAALWDGDEVIGVICVDNLLMGEPIRERQLEVLRLYATTLGHLITRKQAEEALRESEQKYRFITEKMADAVWLMDMDFKPTFISPSVTRLFGYTLEELRMLSLDELLTPESFEFAMKTVATELSPERLAPKPRERSVTVELEFRRKDGSSSWSESTITLLRDSEGRPTGLMGVGRDITERKRAERVQAAIHRLSEAAQTTLSLDELFTSIHAIIAQLMPAQNFYIALYEAATETVHFSYYADEFDTTPPQKKKGRGLTDFVLRTGKSLLATPQVFEDLVQSGQVESLSAPSVDWLGVPLKTQRGETIGVMAVQTYTEDVRLGTPDQEVLEFVSTQVAMAIERKRAEEALQRSEEKYRVLVENLNEVIFTVDRQGLFTYISPAIERYTGFHTDQVIGQPFSRFVHPDDLPGLVTSFERSLAGQSEPYEFRVYSRDGKVRYVRTSSRVLVENGQVVGLTGVMSDITRRRQAEEALRESEEQYRALYEDNPSMYFTVDPAGTVLSVNRFGCEQLGYTASELVGQSVLKVFHDEDRDAAAQSVARCAETPGQVFHWELRKVHKTGDVLWVKETARAMGRPDGQVVVFIVCEDVTERKLAEEEREALQAQLFQAQKMEVLGRLAGGVAHDFNNMLLAILGHTELAMRRCSPEDPIHDYLQVIEESSYRSADLVRQLLAFARKQTVVPKVLDLNDTVAGMLKMLRRLIGEDVQLVWMPGAGVWPIKIDTSQIDQLLANLCVNARDAITGVGKIVIETRNAVFDEAYCAVHPGFVYGQFVMLAVSDDGCGMTQDVMEHLFEPFFTTKEVGKGTGLGLATVYGIVKQNEGFINVYSESGKGSTFEIHLPRFVGEVVELEAASAAEMPRSRGETVLLVEDEAATLNLCQAVLEELGYGVLAAGTPGEALRQAKAHTGKIHLLITDVVMPEMSGRDLAQVLGQTRSALKVLFTSGYTGDVISHHGVLDEGVHFLQKPFSMRDLASKVREVLE
jgi:PAS domain S-box-containing protein